MNCAALQHGAWAGMDILELLSVESTDHQKGLQPSSSTVAGSGRFVAYTVHS